MLTRTAILGLATTAAAVAAVAVLAQAPAGDSPAGDVAFLGKPVSAADLAAGEEIYAKSCASCHGADLEGQADWRRRLANGRLPAPPHDETGHSWHHSDRNLFQITKGGVGAVVPDYESDMPAFGGELTDGEIAAVLAYIKSTWPERQREFQAEVTANDKGEP